jgi:RND family efflux transporter MFP subunit
MNRILEATPFAIVACLLTLSATTGCESVEAKEGEQTANLTVPVRVANVERAPDTRSFSFHGQTRAVDAARLRSPVGGELIERRVAVGDRVEQGDVIAVVETEGYENQAGAGSARIRGLQAQLEQAQRDLARAERLQQQNAAPDTQLEQAQTRVEQLESSLRSARIETSEARRRAGEGDITAPFAGVVTTVFAERGEFISAGTPVVELEGVDTVELVVDVPQSVASHIDGETDVLVRFPLLDRAHEKLTVRAAGSRAVGAGRLFPLRGVFEGDDVPAGVATEVVVTVPQAEAFLVPIGAVLDPVGGDPHVMLYRDGTALSVAVQPISVEGDQLRVRGDLSPDASVITAGHERVTETARLEAVQ